MKKRGIIILIVFVAMFGTMISGCSNKTESGGVDQEHTYTIWQGLGAPSSYYSDYAENPAIQYMLAKTWKGEDGKNVKIAMEYNIPAAGSAQEVFNTMISTGDYTDVIDLAYYTGSVTELYEQGIIQDLTPYVEEYMPNFMKYLEAHPYLKNTATNLVNGEKKFLQLYSYYNDYADPWGGFCYRRDWIVKYGKNPNDGSAFSGEYTEKNEDGTVNTDSWTDNVIFPSGSTDPMYISDWEWMLGIFQTAMTEEGISDGYCMSLPYSGYFGTGELVSSFSGGGPLWYKDRDTNAKLGMNSDDFRTFLQCMNTWYKNGWIDTAFPEHTSDPFYSIDDTKVRQGKVGLWYGLSGQLLGRSDTGETYTKGSIVFGARLPINDIYGSDAQMNKEPYSFYQMSLEGPAIAITEKASEKDMMALCSFLDYQFTDEGMMLHTFGLSKEQYEESKNGFYTQNGLTEGAYTVSTEKNADGNYEIEYVDKLKTDMALQEVVKSWRVFSLEGTPEGYVKVNHDEKANYRKSFNEWNAYENTGFLYGSISKQISPEDSQTLSKIQTNVSEFGQKSVPMFIKGKTDPFNDADWEAFKKALSKYAPEKVTAIYQNIFDTLLK